MKDRVFTNISWSIEDLKNCLEQRDIKPSRKNIKKLLDAKLEKRLEETSVQCGFNLIDDFINEIFY